MVSSRVTVSIQQGDIQATPAVRLEFSEQISTTGEYALRNSRYWHESFVHHSHPISRAYMITQWLRRIDGIGEITVSHHALVIKVGGRFIATTQKLGALVAQIKRVVAAVLAVEVPWATICIDTNWSYHFGAPLVRGDDHRLNEVKADSRELTDFGRRVTTTFQNGRLTPGGIWPYHLFVYPATRGGRPEEHARIDAMLQNGLGSRKVTIAWVDV